MRRIYILLWIVALLGTVVACQKQEEQTVDLMLEEDLVLEEHTDTEEEIFVHVCGAVQSEGVYELPKGSRIFEAIEKAGGFREDAATTEINQAEVLEDGMKVYVPTVAEILEMQVKKSGKVNINQASKEELMTLPGVGESKAESIIQYREENGSFKRIEDIMQIVGIKEGLYEKIKEFIQV